MQTVVDWCQQTLGIKELDSLWYERLAQTYRTEGLFTKAIETYEKALALPDADTNCLEGLAIALAEDDRLLEACTKMTEAVQFLEQDQEANKERLTDDYKCLGRWKDQLQQAASAIEYTQKALDLTPSDAEARFSLLQLYLEHNEGAALVTFMNKLAEAPYDGKTPTPFAEIMKAIALNSNHDWLFSRFFSVISTDAKLSAVLMVELDRCIVRAEKGPTTDLSLAATLQLYKGIALYNYAMKGLAETDSAIPCWDRCLKIGLDTQWNWAGRIQASRLMASHFFEQARRSTDPADRQKHFERLRALAEDGNPFEVSPARTYLAVYYLLHHDDGEDNVQKQEQRKKLSRGVLRQAISSAFELLSDDDEDNDVQGFLRLAEILRFSGDEVNARAAYSVAIPGFPEEAMSWLLDFPNEPERSLGITLAREANEHGFWQISQKIDWVLQELDRREGRKPPQTENGQNEQLEASGKGEEDDDKGDNGPGHVNEGRDSTNGVNHDGEEVDGKRKEKEADGDHSESDNVAAEAAEEAKEADMPEKERLLEEEQEPDEAQSGAEEKQTSETTNEGHEPTAADPTPLPGAEAIRHALTVRYRRAARYDLYWKSCDGVCEPTTVWDFSNDIWTCVFCYNIDFCSSCRDKLASGNLRTLKTNGQRCNSTHRWMRLPKWDRATFMRSLEGLVTVGVEVADDGTAVGGEAVPFRTWIDGLKKEWEWAEEKAEAEAEAEAGAGGEAHHGENETAATMASKAEDVAEGQEGEERHGKANGEALANGSVSGNAA